MFLNLPQIRKTPPNAYAYPGFLTIGLPVPLGMPNHMVSSNQLNISGKHMLFDGAPPHNINIAPSHIELPVRPFNMYDPNIPQRPTKHSRVFVRRINHTDSTRSII